VGTGMAQGQLRGAATLLVWLLAPLVILWPLARLGFIYALGPLLPWKLIVYPHDWIVFRSRYSSTALFSGRMALIVAATQWVLVIAVFASLTQRLRLVHQLWLAPLIILLVAIALQLLIFLCGYQIEADWV